MLAFPISLLPKFTSKSSVMNVTWDRKRMEERERECEWDKNVKYIVKMSKWIVGIRKVHWKSVEISAFVISIPFEFNAMWRHKVLYQSHGILQWTCATPPISTPTQRHLMFGMERSCYQPRNWVCVCVCVCTIHAMRYSLSLATALRMPPKPCVFVWNWRRGNENLQPAHWYGVCRAPFVPVCFPSHTRMKSYELVCECGLSTVVASRTRKCVGRNNKRLSRGDIWFEAFSYPGRSKLPTARLSWSTQLFTLTTNWTIFRRKFYQFFLFGR